MNEHCEKLVNSVISSNKKVTLDYLLDLCDEYDLTPAEVDWVAEKLLELHRIKTNDIPTDSVHAEQFSIANDIPYFYDYPEYDRMVTFAIMGSTKKSEESRFQNGLEIVLTKENDMDFGNPIIYVSAEGYGRIGKAVSPLDTGNLFARTLCEKFFCIDTNRLNSIIDSKMSAKIIEAYADCAVCVLMKK